MFSFSSNLLSKYPLRECNKINHQKCSRICVKMPCKNFINFWGRGGGHQKIILDYRGEGGDLEVQKKHYAILLMVPHKFVHG